MLRRTKSRWNLWIVRHHHQSYFPRSLCWQSYWRSLSCVRDTFLPFRLRWFWPYFCSFILLLSGTKRCWYSDSFALPSAILPSILHPPPTKVWQPNLLFPIVLPAFIDAVFAWQLWSKKLIIRCYRLVVIQAVPPVCWTTRNFICQNFIGKLWTKICWHCWTQ